LRIISWNCSQAFRKKWTRIAEMFPDIAIIQECESIEKMKKCYEHFGSATIPIKESMFSLIICMK
jgi:hypothetical protein